jgi:hypothetical protein
LLIDVVVIAVCAALVVAGVVLVVRWGSGRAEDVATRSPVRSALLTIAAGAIAGVLGAGAGGRLVMRLLALTSPDSEGQITEGGAAIGAITVGGTLGFFVFVGAAAGVLSALLYVLVGSLLPRGRAGGVVLGVVLLLLAGTRLDPLRADNFDFNLVGPDWLSLLSFTCLAIFQGMLMWALAGRLNLRPLPIGRRALTTGRIAGGVLVLAAAPGFVSAVSEILDHS